MGFAMCRRLGGEKRQADAKRRRRGKFIHLIVTESDPPPRAPIDNGNGSAPRAKSNVGLRA